MKKLVVSEKEFDFKAFSKSILTFLKKNILKGTDPSYFIVKVDKPGGCPEFGPEKGGRDLLAELRQGALLFFPFSHSNTGEPIPCADGKKRVVDEDSDVCLGDIDCMGYLVGLKSGKFTIQSAVHAGGGCPPSPSVDLKGSKIFDSAMDGFLRQFVRKARS